MTGARGAALSSDVLRSFEALGVEVSLAITSARLLQQERESYRFLDRLREVGRSLSTTFDVDRIKQTLCEQSVTLLKADAAQFWDADPASKSAKISTRWGADVGDEVGRAVAFEHTGHPIVRTFLDKTPCIAGPGEGATFFPGNPEGAGAPLIRAAAVPLTYHDELIGVLSVGARRGSDDWPVDLKERLDLLADAAAVALHNARLMKLIEQQTERDSQSGLYNRSSLAKRLESELRRAERNGQSIAVAHLRMDGLREAIVEAGRRAPATRSCRSSPPSSCVRRAPSTSSRATRTTASTSSSSRRARCRRTAPCTPSRRTSSREWTSASSPRAFVSASAPGSRSIPTTPSTRRRSSFARTRPSSRRSARDRLPWSSTTLRPRRTRPRPAEVQAKVSTRTPGTAARAAPAISSSSAFVERRHARLHRLARDRVDLNEREAAAGVHDPREAARPGRDLVVGRRLAAKAQEHGLNDDRMPFRGAREIREDPFEGNRAPRDRLVEALRARVELDPERAAPRREEIVRLAHLLAREARAVRDEDERNVVESRGVAHVEEGPRERQEAAIRRRLAVARKGDVAHRIGRGRPAVARPGRELFRELARHVVDRDRGPARAFRDLPAVDDLAVDAVEVARLLRVEVDPDRDPARPARPHGVDEAVLSARARVERREMRLGHGSILAPRGRGGPPVFFRGPAMPITTGTVLGRYRLLERAGVGGMSEVWKAEDETLKRTVAVKVILGPIAAESTFRERFLREARLVAGLEHPNVLPVFDYGSATIDGEEVSYLVMPLVAGGSLKGRVAGPVPPALAIAWLSAIASALDHAHAKGILHRDVKPGNVLMDSQGRPLLADFGLARSAEVSSGLTATGTVLGTPLYMAPEQATGAALSGRADQYALAVIAFELLAGRVPFSAQSPLAVLHQHVTAPPPPLSSVLPGTSPAVDAVLSRGLAKEPAGRFSSCGAFVAALGTALGVTATATTVPQGAEARVAGRGRSSRLRRSTPRRSRRPPRRRKSRRRRRTRRPDATRGAKLLLAALLLLSAGGGIYLLLRPASPK